MKKMRISVGLIVIALVTGILAQSQSSIEFYDTTDTDDPASKIGWSGNADDGYFFIETPDDGDGIKVKNGNVDVSGNVKAAKFVGDGSELTGINAGSGIVDSIPDSSVTSEKIADSSIKSRHIAKGAVKDENIDSLSWSKIKDIPVGFSDGVDNTGESSSDSARAAGISDSTKSIPDEIVTSGKIAASSVKTTHIADGAVTDGKIDSVSWEKISGIPEGFADGVDDAGESSSDSARAAGISDSTKSIPDAIVTSGKIAASSVKTEHIVNGAVTDGKIDSVSWEKIKDIPEGFADGEDDEGITAADSVRAAGVADSCKKIPDGIVTENSLSNDLSNTIKLASKGCAFSARNTYSSSSTSQKYPLTVSPYIVRSVTITAPANGYALVFASAQISQDTAIFTSVDGGITTSSNLNLDSDFIIRYQGTLKGTIPWSMTRAFKVTENTDYTFKLIFKLSDGGYGSANIRVPSITVLYVRDAIGTTVFP